MKTNLPRGGFYAYGHGFTLSPRVRVTGRARALPGEPPGEFLTVKVTGRDQAHKFHGYNTGRTLIVRASTLYRRCRVVRGSCGRLVYFDRITSGEIAALPEVTL